MEDGLKGAFTLLNFRPDMVRHVSLLLWGSIMVFFICGVFGWTGTPGCFQVVNRAIMWEAKKFLKGLAIMFCDDIMGVCWARDLESEIARMKEFIEGFMGKGSVADEKTEFGRCLVILGYTTDLNRMCVSIAPKNLRKALYAFMQIEEHQLVNFKQMETVSSLAARYGLVSPHMNPLTRVLYAEMKKHRRGGPWLLSKPAKVALCYIHLWPMSLP